MCDFMRILILFMPLFIACCASTATDDKIKKEKMDTVLDVRKEKSHRILEANGIKVNYNLPSISSDDKTSIRSEKEISTRVSILAATNLVAFGANADTAISFLKKHELWDYTTPKEKEFFLHPTEEKKNQESWKAEGIWVMMWALGIVDSLGFPSTACDLNSISPEEYPIGNGKDPNDFIKKSKSLRTKTEILDQADLYYRMDWACVDARLNDITMTKINPSVVYERHYALNWLINYMNQEWDDITCDT